MTWLTSGISSPRAATSEQTSNCTWSLRKESSAAIRARWSRSPCSAAAEKPCFCNERSDHRDIAFAVAEDDRVLEVFGGADETPQGRALFFRRSARAHEALADRRWRRWRREPPRSRMGLCRNVSARRVISGGIVAEKKKVCRVNGTSLQMRSMSGMKPMSSMRSASSITRISMPVRSSLPRSAKSSRRPGVAISTSAPRVIFASWSPNDTPPISSARFSL